MGSETRRRNASQIMVRVDIAEKALIRERAASAGMSAPAWLRALAQGSQPRSRVDQQAFLNLAKANADLGRLGGLLKLALSGQAPEVASSAEEMRRLLKAIDAARVELLRRAEALTSFEP